MQHTPFLKQVVAHYRALGSDISNYCFVFPNRRSSLFFQKFLSEDVEQPTILPATTTISDFIADFSSNIPATMVELMFTLYQAYQNVTQNTSYEFDRFVYWGKVIIDDFNDVDLYMADAEQVFANTAQLKAIATDYISNELKAEIERYLNVKFDLGNGDDDRFWKDFNHNIASGEGKEEIKQKYAYLWQILGDLYKEYNRLLEDKKLTYTGKLSKLAAIKIKQMGAEEFPYDKYVFVGFNVLSTSELAIFEGLQRKRIAEFCWDYASPAFKRKANKGTKFLNLYVKQFPNAFNLEPITKFPSHINVVAMPSRIAQAKYAFKVVNDLIDKKLIANVANAIDTAIVLPDEKLFPFLINSISPRITNANATLGYPLAKSDIASLLNVVAKMHRGATRSEKSVEPTFFRDFVKEVLSHPFLKKLYSEECTQFLLEIRQQNIFNVPQSMFQGSVLEPLFTTIRHQSDSKEVINYLDRIIDFCRTAETKHAEQNPTGDATIPLQSAFIFQYIEVINDIKDIIACYGVPMCESTVFYLVNRLVSVYSVPFQGEPLNGLQMMGVLETRNLDFKNLIILSMNERVFPRRFYKRSFIPLNLRRGFNMSTTDQQEAMTAYYFYRMIARAENVYMLYDASRGGIGSSEYSRFVSQLSRLYKVKINFSHLSVNIKPTESLSLSIPKDERINDLLNLYRTNGSKIYLSASSIKTFIKCPLQFYLKYLERLNDEKPEGEFISAATFGTIVHDTLQELYYPEKAGDKHYFVSKLMIKEFKHQKMEKLLLQKLYKLHLHRPYVEGEEETAEVAILMEGLRLYTLNVLNYDLDLLANDTDYFEVYECEKDHPVHLKVNDSLSFNFTFKADRIDRINGTGALRIIDYKTGKDETRANFDQIINPKKKECHAVLQLLLYCLAYTQEHPEETAPIQPIIYKVLNMRTSGVTISSGKDSLLITNFNHDRLSTGDSVSDTFKSVLASLISDLFSPDTPFTASDDIGEHSMCNHCNFAQICRR